MTPIQALFALLVLLGIGDIYTTLRALKLGGREANPVMRALIGKLGAPLALALTKAAPLALVYAGLGHPWAIYGVPALCCWYGWVLANNLRAIRRLQGAR